MRLIAACALWLLGVAFAVGVPAAGEVKETLLGEMTMEVSGPDWLEANLRGGEYRVTASLYEAVLLHVYLEIEPRRIGYSTIVLPARWYYPAFTEQIILSPDGRKAFDVPLPQFAETRWSHTLDAWFDEESRRAAQGLYLSNDGSRQLKVEATGKESCLVREGDSEGSKYKELGAVAFSPDGSRLAYAVFPGGKWLVVVDGEKLPGRYDRVSRIAFSEDGKHVVYGAYKKPKWMVVVDGREIPVAAEVGPVAVASDGQRIAYAQKCPTKAKDEQGWAVVADGKAGPQYSGVGAIAISSTGNLAYAARALGQKRRWTVVVDGREGPWYDRIGAGDVVGTSISKSNPMPTEGDGGLTGGGGPRFVEGNAVRYIAWKGKSIYEVEWSAGETIPPEPQESK